MNDSLSQRRLPNFTSYQVMRSNRVALNLNTLREIIGLIGN